MCVRLIEPFTEAESTHLVGLSPTLFNADFIWIQDGQCGNIYKCHTILLILPAKGWGALELHLAEMSEDGCEGG